MVMSPGVHPSALSACTTDTVYQDIFSSKLMSPFAVSLSCPPPARPAALCRQSAVSSWSNSTKMVWIYALAVATLVIYNVTVWYRTFVHLERKPMRTSARSVAAELAISTR